MVNIFGYPCIPEKNPTKNHPLSNKKDHKSNIDPNTKGNDGMTLSEKDTQMLFKWIQCWVQNTKSSLD